MCIIIISLGQILLSYMANTSRTRAHTHARTHARAHTHVRTHRRRRLTAVQAIAIRWRPTNRYGQLRLRQCWSMATRFTRGFGSCSWIQKNIGWTETRTRDRMYCQTTRIIRYISRDDQTIIAICSLRTLTDKLKDNYSIDVAIVSVLRWYYFVYTIWMMMNPNVEYFK